MYIMLNYKTMFLTGLLLALPHITYGDDSALLLKSRALASEYATQLQAALQEAMATGPCCRNYCVQGSCAGDSIRTIEAIWRERSTNQPEVSQFRQRA